MNRQESSWRWFPIIALVIVMALTQCTVPATPAPTSEPAAPTVAAAAQVSPTQAAPQEPAGLQYEYGPELLAWAAEIKQKYAGTTLKIATATHPSTAAWKAMTPDFEALTGITVVWDEVELAQVRDKILVDWTSGNYQYDVFYASNSPSPGYLALGMLERLQPYFENEKPVNTPDWYDADDVVLAERLAHSDLENVQIGVPASGECGIMYYRKDIFEKYQKDYPKTWDEVLELAKFFYDQDIQEDGKRVYGIVFRARPSFMLTLAFGGDIYDPIAKQPKFDMPGNAALLKYLHELAQYGPPEIPTLSATDALEKFMAGTATMMFEASALAAPVEDESQSLVAGKVAYAPFPVGPAGEANAVAGASLTISTQSKNKDAAWAFLVWMTSRANQEIYLQNGGVPTRLSAFQDKGLQATYPWFSATLAGFNQALPWEQNGQFGFPKSPSISAFVDAWAQEGSAAISGQISPEEATKNIQAKMLEAIKEEQ
jgi:multiple sugar transport system substrate-binding protein